MADLIASAAYRQLLKGLRRDIQDSLDHIRRYADRQRVLTYWRIGRSIADFTARHNAAPALYTQIARDTGLHPRTLQQCVQFAAAYPQLNPDAPLTWSHYRALMTITSPVDRARWQRQALQGKWEANALLRRIQDQRASSVPAFSAGDAVPVVPRGALYTYRIIKVSYAQDISGGWMVDCGFEIRLPPPPADGRIDNSRTVVSRKTPDGYQLKISSTPAAGLYTYAAIVERVIDGDTLLVNVDCGFGIWIRQRLRLRGIDAPERRTVAGDRAHLWVSEQLADCSFIVIKTYKTDKYDRYLADVFYQPGEGQPAQVASQAPCLNTALLTQGLARPWQP